MKIPPEFRGFSRRMPSVIGGYQKNIFQTIKAKAPAQTCAGALAFMKKLDMYNLAKDLIRDKGHHVGQSAHVE